MRVVGLETTDNVCTYSSSGPSGAGFVASAYTRGTPQVPPMKEDFEKETPKTNDTIQARVKDVKLLASRGTEAMYRIDLELPKGSTYEMGDILKIVPPNIQQVGDGFSQCMTNVRNSMAIPGSTVLFSEADMCQPTTLEVMIFLQTILRLKRS